MDVRGEIVAPIDNHPDVCWIQPMSFDEIPGTAVLLYRYEPDPGSDGGVGSPASDLRSRSSLLKKWVANIRGLCVCEGLPEGQGFFQSGSHPHLRTGTDPR